MYINIELKRGQLKKSLNIGSPAGIIKPNMPL